MKACNPEILIFFQLLAHLVANGSVKLVSRCLLVILSLNLSLFTDFSHIVLSISFAYFIIYRSQIIKLEITIDHFVFNLLFKNCHEVHSYINFISQEESSVIINLFLFYIELYDIVLYYRHNLVNAIL